MRLAVAGLALGLAALALVMTSDHRTIRSPWIVLALTMGWSFIGAGSYAWWRRPENRIGPLMTLVGFTWFAGRAVVRRRALGYTLGAARATLWIGALVHLLVAYPDRPRRAGAGAPARAAGLGGLGAAGAGRAGDARARTTAATAPRTCCWSGTTSTSPTVSSWLFAVGLPCCSSARACCSCGAGAGSARCSAARWRRCCGPARRVAVAGRGQRCIPIALGADGVAQVVDSALIVLITAVPFAFLVGLLRSSLSRAGAVSALFERLGGVSARDALAEALGDDSLALAYWLPDPRRYVDAAGRRVELPAPRRAAAR